MPFIPILVLLCLDPQSTIVVTGTPTPLPLDEADRNIKAIEAAPLRLLTNTYASLLKLDPSIDLRQRSPNALQGDISIRGGGFGQTLVLLDGLRLNDAQSGHHNFDVPLPMEAISQVDILKGSGSTLYGSDAIGGVVNFISLKPESTEFRLRAALGNFGVNQQRASATIVTDRVTQQFSASRDFSTGFQAGRDYRNLSLASTTTFRSKLGTGTLLLAHNDRPFGADQFYGNANSWERTKTWFASLQQSLGEKTRIAFAFRRHTDLFVFYRYRDNPDAFTNRHAVESYQANIRRRESFSPNVTFHYGAEVFRDAIASNNLGSHNRARAAAYAVLDLRALKRFSFSAGLRDELWASANHEFSPSFSGSYWFSSNLKLRASASRAFRLPNYTELYYRDPFTQGSATLAPERAWTYEAGADWVPSARLRTEVTVFQRRERNGIDYVKPTLNDIWRATNLASLRFTGVEAILRTKLLFKQEIDFSYTKLEGARAALAGLLSRYVFNYAEHQGIATWQMPIKNGIVARTRIGALKRVGRAAYAVADLNAAYTRGRIRPYVELTNFTATRYEEIAGVIQPGRAFVGGVELIFR